MSPSDTRPHIKSHTGGQGVSAQALNTSPRLTAPFPVVWREARWADRVLLRFGHIDVYSEPFAGSLAVLLASPPHKREVVCDTDGGICNFWRALAADPDAVAHWADYPTIHDDLTARHRYLVRWVLEHADELRNDPEYYDAKVAGWWVWGISIWIGGGWCQPNYRNQAAPDRIPKFHNGTGVVALNRKNIPDGHPTGAGGRLSAQRLTVPHDQRPHIQGSRTSTGKACPRLTDAATPHDAGDPNRMPKMSGCAYR